MKLKTEGAVHGSRMAVATVATLRTEFPDDMVFEAIPFPFDALVFMLPKGAVRHPPNGDYAFLNLSMNEPLIVV